MELTTVNLHIPVEFRYAYILTFLGIALVAFGAKGTELANDCFAALCLLIVLTVPVVLFHIASANGLLDLHFAQLAQLEVPASVRKVVFAVFQCSPIFGSLGSVAFRSLKRRDRAVKDGTTNA